MYRREFLAVSGAPLLGAIVPSGCPESEDAGIAAGHFPGEPNMLKGKLIHPQILEALGRAGHGSQVLIADGNYPASTKLGPKATLVNLNLSPGLVNCTQVLEALVSDLRDMRPDHIVVTGDLTHLGLPAEFLRARQWLSALGPPSQVTVVPGNHDAYVRDAWGRPVAQWADYMVSDGVSSPDPMAPLGLFPTVRIRGPFAVIGVCTARPSLPLLAVGTIGRAQLARLEKVLETTSRQDLYRIVLIHHPPVSGTVTWHRRLTDSAAFREVLARQGAELVLHGHAHRTFMHQLSTPAGKVPVIGVPSASALGRTAGRGSRYHLYHLRRGDHSWDLRIAVRAYPFNEKSYPGRETLLDPFSS